MSTTSTDSPARAYSTRELRAAAAALAAGKFASARVTDPTPVTSCGYLDDPNVAPALALGPASQLVVDAGGRGSAVGEVGEIISNLVRVRAAHAGAGGSTIALAIADAADATGLRTRVLDAAAPRWSGLIGATVTELGAHRGWRRGRRGDNVLIERVEDPVELVSQVPLPGESTGADLTVLDAGWSCRELDASSASPSWITACGAAVDVLVTRPVELALSQTEATLGELNKHHGLDQVLVVVVGAAKWGRELATAGPRLRTAHERAAVAFMPLLPIKTLPGLGPEPLPRQLTNPAQRLLEQITTVTGPLTATRT